MTNVDEAVAIFEQSQPVRVMSGCMSARRAHGKVETVVGIVGRSIGVDETQLVGIVFQTSQALEVVVDASH